MPQPQDQFGNQSLKGAFESYNKGYTPGPKVPMEEVPDKAEQKASSELGRLHLFMNNTFPGEMGKGEPLVDTVISTIQKLMQNQIS